MPPLRILTAAHVDHLIGLLPPASLLASQSAVFQAYSSSSSPDGNTSAPEIQTPQRLVTTSPEVTSLFMPSYVASSGTACKIVSVPRHGGEDGLPASTLVLDGKGRLAGVVNARRLTALRNACGSALFLQSLPTPPPRSGLVIFGSGAQAHSHATLLLSLFPSLSSLTFVVRSLTPRSAALLSSPSFSAIPTPTRLLASDLPAVEQALSQAGIVVTCTSSTRALFPSKWVQSGTRIVMIGSYKPEMREVDDELVRRAGRVVVDSKEACAREAGELIGAGVGEEGMVELGEVLGGKADAQVGEGGDVYMFKSVGIGAQDTAVARIVLDEAERQGVGLVVEDYD